MKFLVIKLQIIFLAIISMGSTSAAFSGIEKNEFKKYGTCVKIVKDKKKDRDEAVHFVPKDKKKACWERAVHYLQEDYLIYFLKNRNQLIFTKADFFEV